jgi:hypothetical protein
LAKKRDKDKKKKKFKGGIARNAAKQNRGNQFGHLNLPRGISVFKEEPGSRVNLDIMPYEVTAHNHPDRDDEYEIAVSGSLWYKRPYWLHRNIGSDNQAIVCLSSAGEKCPICEYRAQLMKEGAEWNDDSVRALKPSMRNLYVVIPKGNKKYDEVPHIWDISQFLFQDKLNEEIQENEEYETFPDLEEGLTLRIRFSEETLGSNKYAETSRIDFKERDEPYDESILDEIPSLDEILEIPSYKTVEAMFFGGLSKDEVEDEDEDEKDKPSRSRTSSRRESSRDDEDEEEENNQDEDEDEEEKPSRSRRKPTKNDNEDEEEDGKPSRSRRRASKDEDDEEEEEKPSKPSRNKKDKEKPQKPGKSKCPHGHKFGDDCEEYDECDKCERWEECMDASEGK